MKILILLFAFLGVIGVSAQPLSPKQNEKGLYGFVNEAGQFVIKPKYDEIHFDFFEGVACVVKGDKYVLINTAGKEISKSYSWVGYFDDNDLCIVNVGCKMDDNGNPTGGKYGFVDLSGEELVSVRYARIGEFNEQGVALINEGGAVNKDGIFEGGKYGFLHVSGKVLIAPTYSIVGEFAENGLAWVNVGGKSDDAGECTGGKFGYVDRSGVEIVPAQYDFIGDFGQNDLCWVNKGGKPFVSDKKIDAEIKLLAAREKDKTKIAARREELENELTGGKVDILGNKIFGGKYGFVNHSGKEVIPVKYQQTSNEFVEGAIWALDKKYGYIDHDGREITPFAYDGASNFHNGLANVMVLDKKEQHYGLINRNGKEITKLEYAAIGEFKNGFAYVKSLSSYDKKKKSRIPSKYGFVDGDGRLLTAMKYDGIGKIADGVAICRIGHKIGYVDNSGKEITPFILLKATPFSEDVAWVKLGATDAAANHRGSALSSAPTVGSEKEADGKYGLIDRNGIALTDFIYDRAYAPSDGLLAVVANGQAGWIDPQGNEVLEMKYSDVGSFVDGVAPVKIHDKWGYIDKQANILVECRYDDVTPRFENGVAGVQERKLWGGINMDGETVIPIKLASIEDFYEIMRTSYVPGGCKPLSERDAELFNIRKKNLTIRFKISNTIGNEYWDY